MTEQKKDSGLRVLVVGAGIGGLTAAIALRQQGHHVEVCLQNLWKSQISIGLVMVY